MQGGTIGAPGSQYGTYEFSQAENEVIGKCGSRTFTWGVIQIVIAALIALVGLPGLLIGVGVSVAGKSGGALPFVFMYLLEVAFILFLGITWAKAGSALRRVVSTQGNDIPLLMDALARLGTAFLALTILTILGFVIGILALLSLAALFHSA